MLWDTSARTRQPPLPNPLAASSETRLPAAERELRRFVRQHEVCWETEPHVELVAGRRVVVGYDVRLFARHPRGFEADPAAPESRRLQQRLAELAACACPREWPAGLTARFRPDAARLLLRPESEWVPEIAGCLSLQPTDVTFAEVDDAQKGCVHEIEHELAELGVRPRTWRSR